MDTNTLIVILVVAILLFLFAVRDKLKEFSLDFKGWFTLTTKFQDKVEKIPQILENVGINVEYHATDKSFDDEIGNVSNRDVVIDSLASLNQIIRSLARTRNVFFEENADTLLIVDRLIANGGLTAELAGPIRFLYELGKEVREKPKAKIDTISSKKYEFFVKEVVNVVSKLLPTPYPPSPFPPSPFPPRETQVGGSVFPHPEQGRSTAVLHCLAGSLQGQHFSIDKPIYRIGANANNDLVIPNDDYVSGSHAHVNYDQGSLLLYDDGSRNGTFLNGNRLDKFFMVLKPGDKIQLGACTFELT